MACRLHTNAGLLHWRRSNNLAITALDAVGLGSGSGTVWLYRLRLWERFGKVGLLGIGLLGAINIPFYEEMARRIHWWQYSGCRMISFTPWYIVLGEFGIALVLALLARTLRRGSWRQAVIAGIGGGFSIFICYALAFWITDRLFG